MGAAARSVDAVVAAVRPRLSVLIVLAVLVLLVAQYYVRVLFDVTGHERLFAVPDSILRTLVRPPRWAAGRVGGPATMGDLPQLLLVVVYGYLLAAALATVGEAVAAGL